MKAKKILFHKAMKITHYCREFILGNTLNPPKFCALRAQFSKIHYLNLGYARRFETKMTCISYCIMDRESSIADI